MQMPIRQFIALIFWLTTLLPAGLSHAATATYTYDELNRVIKEAYQNGRVIEYTYDAGLRTAADAQRVEAG
jgi:YD repeat-containing protein